MDGKLKSFKRKLCNIICAEDSCSAWDTCRVHKELEQAFLNAGWHSKSECLKSLRQLDARAFERVHSEPGFPDLIILHNGYLLVAECKSEQGKLTEAQREWLQAFGLTEAQVCIWRPSNWDEIVVTPKMMMIGGKHG